MSLSSPHFLELCNIYKESRNKWPLRIDRLDIHLTNYKTKRTTIFLYILWNCITITFFLEFVFTLLFIIHKPLVNIISKSIFFFSTLDFIFVLILSFFGYYAYTNDKSRLLQKSAKFLFLMSAWCFFKLFIYVINTLSTKLIYSENINNELYYYNNRSIYFNYFMEIIITFNIAKSVLTLFTGNFIFSIYMQ